MDSGQQAMFGADRDPLNSGLAPRFVDRSGYPIAAAWEAAARGRQPVGTCRKPRCGGLMLAHPPSSDDGVVVWYSAECDNCGGEIAVRADKAVLRRSSRHSEMPDGAWPGRLELLKRLTELARHPGREAA